MHGSYELKKKNNNKELASYHAHILALRKTLFFLESHNSTISLGSNKVCSRAKATWHLMPPSKSLIDASSIKDSPPSIGAGAKPGALEAEYLSFLHLG